MIRRYFDAWLKKDSSCLPSVFSNKAVYSECYGPEYFGIKQISQWFDDWNKQGTVLKWKIKQFIQQGDAVVAEWYFECDYKGSRSSFDGASIVHFDESGKIDLLKEFQSKSAHSFPYGKL